VPFEMFVMQTEMQLFFFVYGGMYVGWYSNQQEFIGIIPTLKMR
jgi:hypothetical protein